MCLSRQGPGRTGYEMLGKEGGWVGDGVTESVGPLGAERSEFYSSLEGLKCMQPSEGPDPEPSS